MKKAMLCLVSENTVDGDINAHDGACYDLKMLVAEKRKYHVEN